MTREEAKKNRFDYHFLPVKLKSNDGKYLDKFIDKIYDDFEKEYSEFEHKLGCILDTVTGGRVSKPYTDEATINEAINRQVVKEWEYAIEDYKENREEKAPHIPAFEIEA